MGKHSHRLYVAVLLACCVSATAIPTCTGSSYYRLRKSGRASCKECPSCSAAGYGLNTTVKRLENEHGFTSCYDCVRCPAGTFREFDSEDPHCRTCILNCPRLNRYGSVQCGGANKGHCGECKHGFITESKEPNSMCNRKVKDKSIKIAPELYSSTQTDSTDSSRENVHPTDATSTDAIHNWIPRGILYLLVILTIVIAVVGAKCYCGKCRETERISDHLANEVDSKKALIVSNGSNSGEDNIETDGGGQPRGELPTVVSLNELGEIEREQVVLRYYNRILDQDDETLVIAADNISGEKRHEFFQSYLKIEKSKTDPEEERWRCGAISHPEYVLNILKLWLQKNDKNATLEGLCNALVMASFDLAVKRVLDLPENKVSPSTVFGNNKIQKRVEIILENTHTV